MLSVHPGACHVQISDSIRLAVLRGCESYD